MPRPKAEWELLTIKDIARYRQEKGIDSDVQLAKRLGVALNSLRGWKHGERAPSMAMQRKLVAKIKGKGVAKGRKKAKKKTAKKRKKTGKKKKAAKKKRAKKRTSSDDDLVERLLALSSEVNDPSALIEASRRLLEVGY